MDNLYAGVNSALLACGEPSRVECCWHRQCAMCRCDWNQGLLRGSLNSSSSSTLELTDWTSAAAAAAGASGTGKSQVLLGPRGQPGGLLCPLLDDVFFSFDDTSCALSISVEELHNVSS